jgi:hypothetical protein
VRTLFIGLVYRPQIFDRAMERGEHVRFLTVIFGAGTKPIQGRVAMILPGDANDELNCALGEAVIKLWSRLPHDVQHRLFEAAVTARGESIRQQLALFLHSKHFRTYQPVRAVPEPDSLGG